MRSSSLFAPSAIAILSISLLCSLSGTAVSQTATGSAAPLPSITVDAPRQVARPHKPTHHVAIRSTGYRTSPATSTAVAAPMSDAARLAKLERETSSCAGGCQSSFKTGNQPWVGCNASGGVYSFTCRNVGNFKTYDECKEAGRVTGWRSGETSAYCSSLALK